MRIKGLYIIVLIVAGIAILNTSCKKTQTLTTGGQLTFSVDTLKFDTVFTAAGSFTLSLKIYNPQNEAVNISSVRLQNGATTYFHLNVNGAPGNVATDVHIAAHDSVYVFATVDIDPTNANTPFVITDSLIATLNGNNFYVPFTAYGQNAHYLVDSVLPPGTINWDTIKPYVILQSAEVGVGTTLNIPAGCHIYMNADSRLVVLGTLHINGTPTDTVIFQGDRLDRSYFGYQGYPGEWGGIYIDSHSSGNTISFTRLENGGNTALSAQPAAIEIAPDSVNGNVTSPTSPQLTMDHVLIENSIGFGILNFGGSLVAQNCLVDICGSQALGIIQGGYDSLTNCTFAGYSTNSVNHVNSTAAILDYYEVDQSDYLVGSLNAVLQNCIVWGSLDSEVFCDTISANNITARISFKNCLLNVGTLPGFVNTSNCILNQDPLFKSIISTGGTNGLDFHLQASSPAISKGIVIPAVSDDLDGYQRGGSNDIGCYQYH